MTVYILLLGAILFLAGVLIANSEDPYHWDNPWDEQ